MHMQPETGEFLRPSVILVEKKWQNQRPPREGTEIWFAGANGILKEPILGDNLGLRLLPNSPPAAVLASFLVKRRQYSAPTLVKTSSVRPQSLALSFLSAEVSSALLPI